MSVDSTESVSAALATNVSIRNLYNIKDLSMCSTLRITVPASSCLTEMRKQLCRTLCLEARLLQLLATGLILDSAACTSTQVAARAVAPADSVHSNSPVNLAGLPDNQMIRWPALAVSSDTVFVAANLFPLRGDSLMPRPLYLGRLHQSAAGLVALSPLALPAGDFQFAYPRVVSARGMLHLVWAEFRPPLPATAAAWNSSSRFSAASLWHSALGSVGWSAPERIATAYWFGWNNEMGGIAVGASGALHVVAWKGDTGSKPHVNDFRLSAGRWESSAFSYTGLNQASAIVARGDTLVVALVDARADTEHVIVVESSDQGRHWMNPIETSRRATRTGSISRLAFASTPDALLLAIGEKANDSFFLDTIRVVRITGPTTVSTIQVLKPPAAVDQFVLTGTSCGSVVVLTSNLSTNLQIDRLTIPRASSGVVSEPLLRMGGFSAFPGVAATRQSAVAVFAYGPPNAMSPPLSAAMPLRVCPP